MNDLLYTDPRPLEIVWYKEHGAYPERIVTDKCGRKYVIGDWSWNRQHPDKPEFIEPDMAFFARNQDLF